MERSDLSTELRKKAETTAAQILESARLDAERIKAEAAHLVQNRRAASLGEEEEACRAASRSAIAAERHNGMRDVLLAKARLVDRVLKLATSLFTAVTETESYRSTVPQQLENAMPFVGDKGAVVLCSPELARTMREASSGDRLTRVKPDAEMQDGFVVVSADGSVTVDKRLGSRLQRMRPTLAIEIHDRLERL